jgi:hypothetical protein
MKKKRWKFACDWRPRGYNLHTIGGHLGTIWMRVAASQFLHANGRHPGTICLRLAARRTLFLHLLANSLTMEANFGRASSQLHAKPPFFLQARCQNNYLN